MKKFTPNPRYLSKLRLGISLLGLTILLSGPLVGWLVSLDSQTSSGDVALIIGIITVADFLWWLPALVLAGAYYRSLGYEVRDDEVIVHVGVWTKSVKHVPYRTVTNIQINRDIFDRWLFNIGSLNIQTAGMSGTTGAEESLVGLPNVQEVYELVAGELRRFRGAMSPTAAEVETPSAAISSEAMSALLTEVRAIRQTLEQRQ
jgi:uncharacterized membrane protein YdbT with pleckstrin-like domain